MKRCRQPALHDTHTHTPPFTDVRRLAIAIRREIDWIVREARLAGDGREAEKRSRPCERGVGVAVAWSANGESGAARLPVVCPAFSRARLRWPQSGPAAAAIAASTGRNRVRLFLYIRWLSSAYRSRTIMTTIVRDIFVFITAAIFVAAAVLVTTGAGAHEFKVGALDIGHP